VVGGAPTLTKLESFSNFLMVVSFGSESPASDTAGECVMAAVLMMQAVGSLTRPDGQRTTLRIGLNTGVLCAGVIGSGSPRYSVFGDTETASQLLHPCPGAGRTPPALSTLHSLRIDFRLTGIKGKGPMRTYALRRTDGRLPSLFHRQNRSRRLPTADPVEGDTASFRGASGEGGGAFGSVSPSAGGTLGSVPTSQSG
ncbi:hypothetical protein T484DRAFT_1812287, partial [Baffinella frigidus]